MEMVGIKTNANSTSESTEGFPQDCAQAFCLDQPTAVIFPSADIMTFLSKSRPSAVLGSSATAHGRRLPDVQELSALKQPNTECASLRSHDALSNVLNVSSAPMVPSKVDENLDKLAFQLAPLSAPPAGCPHWGWLVVYFVLNVYAGVIMALVYFRDDKRLEHARLMPWLLFNLYCTLLFVMIDHNFTSNRRGISFIVLAIASLIFLGDILILEVRVPLDIIQPDVCRLPSFSKCLWIGAVRPSEESWPRDVCTEYLLPHDIFRAANNIFSHSLSVSRDQLMPVVTQLFSPVSSLRQNIANFAGGGDLHSGDACWDLVGLTLCEALYSPCGADCQELPLCSSKCIEVRYPLRCVVMPCLVSQGLVLGLLMIRCVCSCARSALVCTTLTER
jgi:hypothetical protein